MASEWLFHREHLAGRDKNEDEAKENYWRPDRPFRFLDDLRPVAPESAFAGATRQSRK